MASATSKLDILITAKNNASGPIQNIKSELSSLDSAAKTLGGGLGSLAGVAGVAGIAGLGAAVAGAVVDMAEGAAATERLGASFDTLAEKAGTSGDAMLSAMQTASQGTIDNASLMGDANRAMLLGVADSAGEMAQLMDVAAARGKAMGETTAQAFSDLVTGIGRMSPMILDNLGITLDAKKVNDDYAASIGKSADKLTEAEKKQALLNQVIKDSTDLVRANKDAGNDAASNYERMDTAITNAKDSLGTLFSPAIAAIAQNIADATVKATEGMKQMGEEQGKVNQGWDLGALHHQFEMLTSDIQQGQVGLQTLRDQGTTSGEAWDRLTSNLLLNQAQLRSTKQQMLEMSASVDADKAAIQALDLQLTFTTSGLNALGAAGHVAAMGLDAAGNRLPWLIEQLAALRAQSDATSTALSGIVSSAVGAIHSAASAAIGLMPTDKIAQIYTETSKKVSEQVKIMHDLGMSTEEIDFRTQEYAKHASQPFDMAVDAAAEAEKASKAYGKSLKDAANDAEQAFNALQGKVLGVLQGALDPGVGVDPEDVLTKLGFPREQTINENARRLADIAKNGLKNQDWIGAFRHEVPDLWEMIRLASNPQEEAARLLRDFQDGLITSPIDKGKAKEIVKRQILGEQNMNELATEIATELSAEMGVPLQTALAAAQGTIGGGTGMGSQVASQFSDGAEAALDETGGGGNFVTKFTDQMRAQYPLLSTAGKDAGRLWGSAFLETVGANVPPALIKIIVDLASPGIMAALAQKATLTGATP